MLTIAKQACLAAKGMPQVVNFFTKSRQVKVSPRQTSQCDWSSENKLFDHKFIMQFSAFCTTQLFR